MKEAMGTDRGISYLRKLNLQLMEQHMKGNHLITVVYWKMCDLVLYGNQYGNPNVTINNLSILKVQKVRVPIS